MFWYISGGRTLSGNIYTGRGKFWWFWYWVNIGLRLSLARASAISLANRGKRGWGEAESIGLHMWFIARTPRLRLKRWFSLSSSTGKGESGWGGEAEIEIHVQDLHELGSRNGDGEGEIEIHVNKLHELGSRNGEGEIVLVGHCWWREAVIYVNNHLRALRSERGCRNCCFGEVLRSEHGGGSRFDGGGVSIAGHFFVFVCLLAWGILRGG
ncbi:hypothetical protein CASFOL_005938 [Castilleja foliolosa]|uniref:Uncharacterized protein n=1 Tax=Castilleja foliolosa TaxID=1961234 RepID=A0ABD3E4V5_9LAMI